jgi:predicted RNA-binding protein
MSVVVEHEGAEEMVMDNVTTLRVMDKGVVLTTFFEEPLSIPDVVISRIDFLGGKVFLKREPDK